MVQRCINIFAWSQKQVKGVRRVFNALKVCLKGCSIVSKGVVVLEMFEGVVAGASECLRGA